MSLALPPAQFFAGLDWAAEVHAVCVMDATGTITGRFTIKHSAEGIAMLIRRLVKLAGPADVQIGIERPNGRLVDLLLEAGHPVVPVSPNAIKTWREGEVLSGAKSDAGDAAVIAEYVRLRQHRLRVAVPYSDDTRAVRTVVRTRTDLVDMRVAATNQLAALLDAYCGCTPVTKESGKHRAVHFRWSCNKRFRVALTTFADNSRHVSAWAAKIYNDARTSGKDHPHAIRVLARAWIRVIWRCWLDGVPYDPAKHGAAAAHNEPVVA
ncbi:transposase [Microbispora hainanensis]